MTLGFQKLENKTQQVQWAMDHEGQPEKSPKAQLQKDEIFQKILFFQDCEKHPLPRLITVRFPNFIDEEQF